ncbi:MAG: SagB family peptide dehydrogenase [Solirubrobacteraceae bacterium]
MRVKVAEATALFWDQSRLVWDDYIGHRQLALSADSERVLRWFGDWAELDSIDELGDEYLAIAERLLDAGVLIAEDSDEHAIEQRVLANWGPWGPAARYLHLASRTPSGSRFLSAAQDAAEMQQQAFASSQAEAAPPAAKTYPDRPLIPLAARRPDDSGWPARGLLDALYGRRSTRRFTADPVSLDELAAILQVAGGFVDPLEHAPGPAALRTSPAAGALHPVEMYVDASSVDGLEAGMYHFAPTRGGIEALADGDGARVAGTGAAVTGAAGKRSLDAVGGQPWLAEAPVLILYTAVIERLQWRYRSPRAYRDLLIGLGHLSQTVLLLASAMNLGAVFATAVCDEDLERLIGIDGTSEILLGVAALGHPDSDAADQPITW